MIFSNTNIIIFVSVAIAAIFVSWVYSYTQRKEHRIVKEHKESMDQVKLKDDSYTFKKYIQKNEATA